MQPEQSHRGQRQLPLGPQNPPQGLPTILSRGQISGLITYNRDPKTLQGAPTAMVKFKDGSWNLQRKEHTGQDRPCLPGMVAKSH